MEKRRWKGGVFHYSVRECREDRDRFFLEVHSEGIRGHEHELQKGKFWTDVRKEKVHNVSDQSLQQIAQRGWRYSMFYCDLKLKLNIAWRLTMLWVGGWITFRNPRWHSEIPCKIIYKQNVWFPEVILAGSIKGFCLVLDVLFQRKSWFLIEFFCYCRT